MGHRPTTFLVLLVFLSPSSFADTYPTNPDIDILHYRFELDLSDESGHLAAAALVRAKFLSDGTDQLRLDLINRSDEHDGKGMTVSQVTYQDEALHFQHEEDVLLVSLNPQPKAGDVVDIQIDYAGHPVTGLLLKENKHGDLTAFSDNWPN